MNKRCLFHYYVEGQCEKKLLQTLKDKQLIVSGKIEVFNVTQDLFNATRLRLLPPNSVIVLVFDTDVKETDTLVQNICSLRKQTGIYDVFCIPQVRNLEDEIIRCTEIRTLKELLNCKSNSDFKQAFIAEKNLYEKLRSHYFDIQKLWSTEPAEEYRKQGIRNQSREIKIRKSK